MKRFIKTQNYRGERADVNIPLRYSEKMNEDGQQKLTV
jgi:hypothetical protein